MTMDYTDGFFTRWIIVDFPNSFKENPDFDLGEKKADPDLLSKLCNPTEFSAFLNWALEGLERLSKQKRFSNSATVEHLRKDWMRRSNSVYAFVQDSVKITYELEDMIDLAELRTKYLSYCRKHKLIPVIEKKMKQTFEQCQMVADRKRVRLGVGNDLRRIYRCCKFLE